MAYVLEGHHESERLEKQASQEQYSVAEELLRFTFPGSSADVLDVGCGSGVVSRYLAENFERFSIHTCDYSEVRVRQAESLDLTGRVNFFQSDILSGALPKGHFDVVIAR